MKLHYFPDGDLIRPRGLKGFWSGTVSGNWRVIFRMEKVMHSNFDFVDYH